MDSTGSASHTSKRDRTESVFLLSALLIEAFAILMQSVAPEILPQRATLSTLHPFNWNLLTVTFALTFWTLGLRGWHMIVSAMLPGTADNRKMLLLVVGIAIKAAAFGALLLFISAAPGQVQTFGIVSLCYLLLATVGTAIYYSRNG